MSHDNQQEPFSVDSRIFAIDTLRDRLFNEISALDSICDSIRRALDLMDDAEFFLSGGKARANEEHLKNKQGAIERKNIAI